MSRSREQSNQISPEEQERLCMEAAQERISGRISSDEYRTIILEHGIDYTKVAKALRFQKLPNSLRAIMNRLI